MATDSLTEAAFLACADAPGADHRRLSWRACVLGAVDAGRLGDLAGRVTPGEQWGIDEALETVLGLR